jgi:hypothetical protein
LVLVVAWLPAEHAASVSAAAVSPVTAAIRPAAPAMFRFPSTLALGIAARDTLAVSG